ncbi:hypothetical protein [Flaviaesturariibacter aridisoli]|uniref:Uncharacterized protein n=1 Tax=Flaviaesturariibacter aridisoli TaxID=2545761 RepID=A0A4R4E6I3_9BACT|nr:hypothetical protein [Flaviaesturariibacter aridisoli]TCZ74390.1 hypothetical protein E0486_01835 [Flaviaesturariibacter aridisoli]
MRTGALALGLLGALGAKAQTADSAEVEAVRRMVTLSEVVVRSDLNVPRFLQRIRNDSSYYKAFKNLHILGYTSENYIELFDKKGRSQAGLRSKTRQHRDRNCRTMEVLEEAVTGDFYDGNHNYNYYTAQLYDAFFFTHGTVCGETNIVAGSQHSVQGKKGLEKNKEQLKMLFFNPGQKIPGIPFIGNKLDVFDEEIAQKYNYSIDTSSVINGIPCYVFRIERRDDLSRSERGDIVFDNITTWFNQKTMEIVGRNYDLSYDAGVYDFDVHMKVEMMKVGDYLVPYTLSYRGNWHLMFKGRERGLFNATLHDFKIP